MPMFSVYEQAKQRKILISTVPLSLSMLEPMGLLHEESHENLEDACDCAERLKVDCEDNDEEIRRWAIEVVE